LAPKEEKRMRAVVLYKNYFADFFAEQKQNGRDKILWTLRIIENQQYIPSASFEHVTGTDGLYEIRVQQERYFSHILLL
jgi:hypothetical protein